MRDSINPAERRLEIALEEHLGAVRIPDMRYRIVSAARDPEIEADEPEERRPRTRVLAAGLLAYAVCTVIVIAATFSPTRHARQDPRREFEPASLQELKNALPKLSAMTIESRTSLDAMLALEPVAAGTITLDETSRAQLRDELSRATLVGPSEDMPLADVWLELDGGRAVHTQVLVHHPQQLRIAALGQTVSISRASWLALRAAVDRSEARSRLAQGVVLRPSDIAAEQRDALPRTLSSLRIANLSDDDLAAVTQFRQLRHLDVSAAAGDLSEARIRQVLDLPALTSLVVHPDQANVHVDRIAGARGLRRLGLHAIQPDDLFGRPDGCMQCHMPARAPQPPQAGPAPATLRTLLEDSRLEHLALCGFRLAPEINPILESTPSLTSLDFRCSDVLALEGASLQAMPLLREIDLRKAYRVEDDLLARLGAIKSLRLIDLRGATGASPEQLEVLRAALPSCEVLTD